MIKFTNLLILLCSLLPLGAQQWYRSNNLGMMLEEIEDPLQEEWTLQQNIQGNIQQKILYENEEERRRWDLELLTDGQTEQRFYLEGILLYIQKYDDQDRLIEEQWYQAGELDNTQIYHYPQDRLILRDIMDPQGNILLHDEFRLDHQGRLLWLKRQSFSDQDMPVNSSSLSGFTQHWEIPGNLDSGWVMRKGRAEQRFYDDQGRLVRQLIYQDDQFIQEELLEYDPQGILQSKTTLFPVLEERQIEVFDIQGNVLRKQLYRRGLLVSQRIFQYNDGRLEEEILKGQGPAQRWVYNYQQDELESIDYYLAGELMDSERQIPLPQDNTEEDSKVDNTPEEES